MTCLNFSARLKLLPLHPFKWAKTTIIHVTRCHLPTWINKSVERTAKKHCNSIRVTLIISMRLRGADAPQTIFKQFRQPTKIKRQKGEANPTHLAIAQLSTWAGLRCVCILSLILHRLRPANLTTTRGQGPWPKLANITTAKDKLPKNLMVKPLETKARQPTSLKETGATTLYQTLKTVPLSRRTKWQHAVNYFHLALPPAIEMMSDSKKVLLICRSKRQEMAFPSPSAQVWTSQTIWSRQLALLRKT